MSVEKVVKSKGSNIIVSNKTKKLSLYDMVLVLVISNLYVHASNPKFIYFFSYERTNSFYNATFLTNQLMFVFTHKKNCKLFLN